MTNTEYQLCYLSPLLMTLGDVKIITTTAFHVEYLRNYSTIFGVGNY